MNAVYAAAIPTQTYLYSNTSLPERFHLCKPLTLCNGKKYTLVKFYNSLHEKENYSACVYTSNLANTTTPLLRQYFIIPN